MPAAVRPRAAHAVARPGAPRRPAAVRGIRYFVREGVEAFRRNGLMSVAAVTITVVTLVSLGAAIILAGTLDSLAGGVERRLQVIVYLHEGLSPSQVDGVRGFLARLPGATGVAFVSKEAALESFQRRMGGKVDLRGILSHNPLPASFEVTVDAPQRLRDVAESARGLRQVEHASYGAQVANRLVAVTRLIRLGGVVITVGLAVVATIIIVNTIRLTVLARRAEIEIMRLVGATAWFIRWPFVVEGAISGALAGVAAVVLVSAAYTWVAWATGGALPFLPLVSPLQVAVQLSWKLLLWGVVIGIAGSLLALRRFLSR